MKENKIRLKIGEFSKLCQVSVKTLRYYDSHNLLSPHEVDEWTGYRYYEVSQIEQMNHIRHLKSLGFSLDEIKQLKEEGHRQPTRAMIETKLNQCEEEIAKLLTRKSELTMLSTRYQNKKKMENFIIRPLPAIVVASHRQIIQSYDELFNLCPNVIGPEMMRLGCECPEPGYCYTIDHNKEYRTTNIDIEYCEQVKERRQDSELIQFKEVEEVKQALCYKHYGSYKLFPESWEKLMAYIEKEGYRIADAPRFCYIDGIWNKESEAEWLTEIQVPLIGSEE